MWRRATQRARASKRWRSSVVNCIEVVGYGRGDIILIIVRYACARSTPSGAVHRTRTRPARPVASRASRKRGADRRAGVLPSQAQLSFTYPRSCCQHGLNAATPIRQSIRSDPRTGSRGARARPHPARYPHAAGAPTTPTAPTRSLAGCAPTSRPVRDRPPRVQAASYRAIGTLLRTRQT